jgi:hypothetical protein
MELEQSGGVSLPKCFRDKECSSRVHTTEEIEAKKAEDLIELQEIENKHPKYTTNPELMYNEILRIMKSYTDDENIQILGFKILNYAWNYPWNNMLFMEKDGTKVVENGINVVVAAMNNHLNNADIQESGFYFLQKIVDSSKNPRNTINILVSAGGIKAIVAVMKKHLDNAIIQKSGCWALRNIAAIAAADETMWEVLRKITANADKTKRKVVAEGGIEAVVAAMNAHTRVADVQENGCAALGNIAMLSEENMEKVAEKGGIEAVVAAMEEHLNNAEAHLIKINAVVQESGCRALGNIAATAKTKQEVAKKGGIKAVVAAMNAYLNNAFVQEQGYYALWNIAFNDKKTMPKVVLGSINVMVAIMNAELYLDNADVQEFFCKELLKKITKTKKITNKDHLQNLLMVVAAGGIKAVVAAMKNHLNNAAVQQYGCIILMGIAVLAENKPKVAVAVAGAGGIEAVVAAMNEHAGDAVVQEFGCGALANIAALAENQPKVAAAKGIEAVVAAMKAHTDVAAIQKKGCWALSNIAMLDDNQPKVAAAKGIEAVVAAMRKYPNNADIKKNGCGVLQSITNNMNTIQLIDISVLESIINIDICPGLENILDNISIDKIIKIKIDFININEHTLSCEELLKNIRYFDDHIYENRTVTKCGHVFHTTCLNRWILEQKTCPNCRKELKVGGNSEDKDKEECSICLENLENENLENENRVIINKDRFITVSASYNVFIEILDRNKCNDPELKKRIDGYKPKAGPSSANAGGKKKIKR